ncbi:hypothetical protein Tco_0670432, partial [Tanacetum coccineum]
PGDDNVKKEKKAVDSRRQSIARVQSGKSEIRRFGGTRVIPFGHELQATLSLTLPESNYNKNIGLFEEGIGMGRETDKNVVLEFFYEGKGEQGKGKERMVNVFCYHIDPSKIGGGL